MVGVTKSGLSASKGLILPINLSLRITGALYAVVGGVAGLGLAWNPQAGWRGDANLFAVLILGVFAVFGLALSFSVENLSIHPAARTYRYRKGLGIFVRTQDGPTSDILDVFVERVFRSRGDGEVTRSTRASELIVSIRWQNGRDPLPIYCSHEQTYFGSSRNRVLIWAGQVAASLGVMLVDQSQE